MKNCIYMVGRHNFPFFLTRAVYRTGYTPNCLLLGLMGSCEKLILLVGLPSYIVFRLSLYMSGKVTLGLVSPYHLGRVTLLEGLAVCLLKPCKSSK